MEDIIRLKHMIVPLFKPLHVQNFKTNKHICIYKFCLPANNPKLARFKSKNIH
jgi:hypothetical protein